MEVIGVDWPKRSISWTSGSGSGRAADTKNTLHLAWGGAGTEGCFGGGVTTVER